MSTSPLPRWSRAHGEPIFSGAIRQENPDFQVIEQLGWEPEGDGEHDYLWLEKIGANTEWVARQLAAYAGVPTKDVGYSGLKDRHAITYQWFSVPRWHAPQWDSVDIEGVRLLRVERHLRKLRRGAHKQNAFVITLRSHEAIDHALVADRLAVIADCGVPNYFGEQRFGRNGSNFQLVESWATGKRLPRHKRGLAISVARAYLFNEILSARATENTWDTLIAGDLANLDGSGSVFDVPELTEELRSRCEHMDIHPAGLLAGEGLDLGPQNWQQAFKNARVEPAPRSYRLRVEDLSHEFIDGGVVLRFTLARGAYATSVLRELCHW